MTELNSPVRLKALGTGRRAAPHDLSPDCGLRIKEIGPARTCDGSARHLAQ